MKKFIAITGLFLLSACYTYEPKYNLVEDAQDEIKVTPPDCPNWSEPAEGGYFNDTHSNYACATVTNYGVMATNPHDLLKGRGTNADAERTRLFVSGYNTGSPSNTANAAAGTVSTDSGTASAE